jgi:hypothetical protein
MDLMPLFVEKDIFPSEAKRPGKPILDVLRNLDAAGQLSLLKHAFAIRHLTKRSWYLRSEATL